MEIETKCFPDWVSTRRLKPGQKQKNLFFSKFVMQTGYLTLHIFLRLSTLEKTISPLLYNVYKLFLSRKMFS